MVRGFGRFLGRMLAVLAVLAAVLWFWPGRGPLSAPQFDAAALPEDLDGYLAGREGLFDDVTPDVRKRILWAGEPGVRTPLSIVYLHGFSATSEEIRPVPDTIAAALGANLYFTRLAGHGRDGPALATATPEDWMTDLAEALAIGARIGDRIVVMGTSTGATLAVAGLGAEALRAAMPAAEKVAGMVFVSPNFRLRSGRNAFLIDLPLADLWLPLIAGTERGFVPANEAHARYWTTRYPTAAVFPMARLQRAARAADHARIRVPVLMVYSPDDQVVNPDTALKILENWGGPVRLMAYPRSDGMDAEAHVIAGDIRSPAMTAPVAAMMTDWIGGL